MPVRLLTPSQVAEQTGIDRDTARAFLTFLAGAGIAAGRGVRRPLGGRKGRGENLYELPADVGERVGAFMRRLP